MTTIREHWNEAKAGCPDAVLILEADGAYHTYGEDAEAIRYAMGDVSQATSYELNAALEELTSRGTPVVFAQQYGAQGTLFDIGATGAEGAGGKMMPGTLSDKLRSPVGGVTIGGKFYPGGQWIPKGVVQAMTPQQKQDAAAGKPVGTPGAPVKLPEARPLLEQSERKKALAEAVERGEVDETGKPTEDAAAAYKRLGTKAPQFKEWFGDWENDPANASKVVDPETGEPKETHELSQVVNEEGTPVRVYHGTSSGGFESFDASKLSDPESLLYGPGFYFTEDEGIAAEYSTNISHKEYHPKDWKQIETEILASLPDGYSVRETPASTRGQSVPMLELIKGTGQKVAENSTFAIQSGKPGYWTFTHDKAGDFASLHMLQGLMDVVNRHSPKQETKEVFLNIRKPFPIDEPLSKVSRQDKERFRDMLLKAVDDKKLLPPGDFGPGTNVDHMKADITRVIDEASESAFTFTDTFARLTNYTHGTTLTSKAFRNELLQSAGFDGITHTGGQNIGTRDHKVWIAFSPNQIKSTDNVGTFDPADDRMKYASADQNEKDTDDNQSTDSPARYAKTEPTTSPTAEENVAEASRIMTELDAVVDSARSAFAANMAMRSNRSMDTFIATAQKYAADPWQPYTGPRGGKGWKNSQTGYIFYGPNKPGAGEEGEPPTEAEAGAAPEAPEPTMENPLPLPPGTATGLGATGAPGLPNFVDLQDAVTAEVVPPTWGDTESISSLYGRDNMSPQNAARFNMSAAKAMGLEIPEGDPEQQAELANEFLRHNATQLAETMNAAESMGWKPRGKRLITNAGSAARWMVAKAESQGYARQGGDMASELAGAVNHLQDSEQAIQAAPGLADAAKAYKQMAKLVGPLLAAPLALAYGLSQRGKPATVAEANTHLDKLADRLGLHSPFAPTTTVDPLPEKPTKLKPEDFIDEPKPIKLRPEDFYDEITATELTSDESISVLQEKHGVEPRGAAEKWKDFRSRMISELSPEEQSRAELPSSSKGKAMMEILGREAIKEDQITGRDDARTFDPTGVIRTGGTGAGFPSDVIGPKAKRQTKRQRDEAADKMLNEAIDKAVAEGKMKPRDKSQLDALTPEEKTAARKEREETAKKKKSTTRKAQREALEAQAKQEEKRTWDLMMTIPTVKQRSQAEKQMKSLQGEHNARASSAVSQRDSLLRLLSSDPAAMSKKIRDVMAHGGGHTSLKGSRGWEIFDQVTSVVDSQPESFGQLLTAGLDPRNPGTPADEEARANYLFGALGAKLDHPALNPKSDHDALTDVLDMWSVQENNAAEPPETEAAQQEIIDDSWNFGGGESTEVSESDEANLAAGMEQRPDGSWYDPKKEAELAEYDPQAEEFAKTGAAQKFARALASGHLPDLSIPLPTPEEQIAEADRILAIKPEEHAI